MALANKTKYIRWFLRAATPERHHRLPGYARWLHPSTGWSASLAHSLRLAVTFTCRQIDNIQSAFQAQRQRDKCDDGRLHVRNVYRTEHGEKRDEWCTCRVVLDEQLEIFDGRQAVRLEYARLTCWIADQVFRCFCTSLSGRLRSLCGFGCSGGFSNLRLTVLSVQAYQSDVSGCCHDEGIPRAESLYDITFQLDGSFLFYFKYWNKINPNATLPLLIQWAWQEVGRISYYFTREWVYRREVENA